MGPSPPPGVALRRGPGPHTTAERGTDSGMCVVTRHRLWSKGGGQADWVWDPPDSPSRRGPPPTPKVLDDVQGGAPGEALPSPQLQPGQGTGQGLQLIGAPLLPVEKHAEAWGGLPTRPVPAEAGRPRGPGSPRPGRSGHRGCRGAAGTLGLALGRQARPSPGKGSILGAAGGPGADQWPGPRPHTKRLSSPPTDILQISTSRPPRSPHFGDGPAVWGRRRPGKECDCSMVSQLR